jgi:uncharacterized membrane protein
MDKKSEIPRKRFLFTHFKTYIFRGLLTLIPLFLTLFVIRLLYTFIDQNIMDLFDQWLKVRIPGFGLFLLLLTLYFAGLLGSRIFGRQVLGIIEKVSQRIPLIGTTYRIGKQLAETLSLPEKQVFKKVVLVDFLKPGIWTIGFVTGTIIDTKNNNQKLLKVFIPTPPNPTSGTMVVVKESETRDPGWSIEEALKAVLSGGVIGPSQI